MKTTTTEYSNKFLKVKKVINPEKGVNGYLYAERLGTDSVAFILIDRNKNSICVNHEYKPPVDKFINTAFGGSLDKNRKDGKDFNDYLFDIIIAETKEEAGYIIDKENVSYMGKKFVSTQMNQFCYLFLVDVTGKTLGDREPENEVEASSSPIWFSFEQYYKNNNDLKEDWKTDSIMIELFKRSK